MDRTFKRSRRNYYTNDLQKRLDSLEEKINQLVNTMSNPPAQEMPPSDDGNDISDRAFRQSGDFGFGAIPDSSRSEIQKSFKDFISKRLLDLEDQQPQSKESQLQQEDDYQPEKQSYIEEANIHLEAQNPETQPQEEDLQAQAQPQETSAEPLVQEASAEPPVQETEEESIEETSEESPVQETIAELFYPDDLDVYISNEYEEINQVEEANTLPSEQAPNTDMPIQDEVAEQDDAPEQNPEYIDINQSQSIQRAQAYLRELARKYADIPAIVPNGLWQSDTTQGIKVIQSLSGLPVTGVLDERTWQKLVDEYMVFVSERAPREAIRPWKYNKNHIITLGDVDEIVYIIQVMINALSRDYSNMPRIAITGSYDRNTKAAIRMLQKKLSLPMSGDVDSETWDSMARLYNYIVAL